MGIISRLGFRMKRSENLLGFLCECLLWFAVFLFFSYKSSVSTNILGIIRIKYLAWFPVLSRKKIPEKRVCFGPTLGIFAVLQFLICPNHPIVIFHRMLLVLYKSLYRNW